jgi:hypothetical protein
MWGGGHGVERNGISVIFARGIKDLAVFLSRFFEEVPWCDEAVGNKPPQPVWDVNYVVVAFFLVRGDQYLAWKEGWLPFPQYRSVLLRVVVALKWFGHHTVMTHE